MPTRNLVITDHQASMLEHLVSSGRYQNASEVLREGLRLVEQRDAEDAYRLDAQRRTVALDGFKASVVLYSNQELDKPIGTQKRAALKSAPQGKTIRFAITPKGKLKVISEQ